MTTPRVDICICTFRRPELAAALRSVAAMNFPAGYEFAIIVADNDEHPSAQELVKKIAAEISLPVTYRHCPARNISLARNGCLDASSADYVAFLDDDETATPHWIAELLETIRTTDADVVLGPVRAVYGPQAPAWMRDGDFHSTLPVWVKGEIRTGYTCNVLMRMSAPGIAGRRFSLERGQSGGEDTEFFDLVHRAGGTIAFAPRAWVEEIVPPSRSSFEWLAQRRFRIGQTHGHLLKAKSSALRVPGHFAAASAKAVYCLAGAMLTAVSPVRRNRNILRGVMHLGVVGGLAGLRELRLYGLPKQDGRTRHAA
ncbi:glycosyltransferase family 2 protein [Aquamicrobium sp. LC103]|uniref:glycosyltransferase n=1 Tax=Aquamicrobium sp. LC103 TaxID=1120658 RepID=UPI00063EB808|nr:glycosyltransferase family 2 protein [Aquamicrobium sp. LC103]TKT69333.1 glycosyltransferase family 2 protein [Aquamicrobium sp. LC103]